MKKKIFNKIMKMSGWMLMKILNFWIKKIQYYKTHKKIMLKTNKIY